MSFDGILRIHPKFFNDYILFNPSEEDFDTPTMPIDVGNFDRRQFKVVGYEVDYFTLLFIKRPDQSQIVMILVT
jgi:hypothetical protein